MRRHTAPWALALLIAALLLCTAPAAALDEYLNEWTDTSGAADIACSGSTYASPGYVDGLKIIDITKAETLNYVVFDISENSTLAEGTTYTTYTLNGETHDCAISVSKTRNLLGTVTASRITIFLYDWEIGTLSGSYRVSFGEYLWKSGATVAKGYHVTDGDSDINIVASKTNIGYYPPAPYSVTYSTGILWQNRLTVSEDYLSSYQIGLQRVFGDTGYYSNISVLDGDGQISFQNTGSIDISEYVLQKNSAQIILASPSKDYIYQLSTGLPVESEYFSLALSPTTAAVGDPVQATLTADADAPPYDMVEWTIDDDWRPYRLVTGTWYAYNASTQTYADAVTEAAALSQTCQFAQEGNGPVFCRVYDIANGTLLADLKEYVTVSGTSAYKFPLYVAVFDADTGATLMSVQCQITDLDTAAVSTTTIQTSRAGETFLLDSSDRYQVVVSKTGYESRTWSNIRSDTSSLTAYLPKTAGGPTDIYIYFSVHDTGGAPVQNALVGLTGLTPTLTNAQGSVKLLAATNTTYTYSVSADGYIGATDTLETSATSLWYECTLTPTGGAATTTTTPAAGSSENLDDAMAIWTENLKLIAALLFMAFIIGILKLMV